MFIVWALVGKARSWHTHRWVVARLECGRQGPNPRFVISSRYDEGFKLYYDQYCARGDMENRIKDQQLDRLPTAPPAQTGGPTSGD